MITCEEFTDRVSDYLDDRIPFGEKVGMYMHRLLCVRCRNYYRQLQELVQFVKQYDEPDEQTPSDEVREELMEEFRRQRSSEA